jgi:hypothetical protein
MNMGLFRKKKQTEQVKAEPKIRVNRDELLDDYYVLLLNHQTAWNEMYRQQQSLEASRDRSYVR